MAVTTVATSTAISTGTGSSLVNEDILTCHDEKDENSIFFVLQLGHGSCELALTEPRLILAGVHRTTGSTQKQVGERSLPRMSSDGSDDEAGKTSSRQHDPFEPAKDARDEKIPSTHSASR